MVGKRILDVAVYFLGRMQEMRERSVPLSLLDQLVADQDMPTQKREPDRKGKIGRQIVQAFRLPTLASFSRRLGGILARRLTVILMLRQHKARRRSTHNGGIGCQLRGQAREPTSRLTNFCRRAIGC